MSPLDPLKAKRMSTGRQLFKTTTLTRALRAAKAAGVPVERYEIDTDGKITVVIGKAGEEPPADDGEPNPWDSAVSMLLAKPEPDHKKRGGA